MNDPKMTEHWEGSKYHRSLAQERLQRGVVTYDSEFKLAYSSRRLVCVNKDRRIKKQLSCKQVIDLCKTTCCGLIRYLIQGPLARHFNRQQEVIDIGGNLIWNLGVLEEQIPKEELKAQPVRVDLMEVHTRTDLYAPGKGYTFVAENDWKLQEKENGDLPCPFILVTALNMAISYSILSTRNVWFSKKQNKLPDTVMSKINKLMSRLARIMNECVPFDKGHILYYLSVRFVTDDDYQNYVIFKNVDNR